MAIVRMVHHPKGYAAIYQRVVNVGDGVTRAVANDARSKAPKDTGAMVSTIHSTRVAPLTWWVHVGTDHWHYQEYGTLGRDPVIRPVLKKALYWQGLPHPVAIVKKHPGNPAQPFMRPSVYQRRMVYMTRSGTAVVSR